MTSTTLPFDYREILKRSHEDRVRVNPYYSLRAFARDLALTPSQLSLILRKKKGISFSRAKTIFSKIVTDPEVLNQCLLQVQAEHSRDQKIRSQAKSKIERHSRVYTSFVLDRNAFDTVSKSFHLIILQALVLKSAPKTYDDQISWLAKKLQLPKEQIVSAVQRMVSLNILEVSRGRLNVLQETVMTNNGVPSVALRQFHRELIAKAVDAIETQKIEERILNSVVLPLQRKELPEIQKDILRFQRSMMKKYGRVREEDGDSVYGLTLQCFALLKAEER